MNKKQCRILYSFPFFILILVSGCAGINNSGGGGTTEPDNQPPVVTILSHTNYQEVGSMYTLAGTASDNREVSSVYVSLNNGSYTNIPVNNNTWSITMIMPDFGTNTNQVYAVDKSGNVSAASSVFVNYVNNMPSVTIGEPFFAAFTITNTNTGLSYCIQYTALFGLASINAPYVITGVELSINGGAYAPVYTIDITTNSAPAKMWMTVLTNALNISNTNTFQARAFSDSGKTNYTPIVYLFPNPTNSSIGSSNLPGGGGTGGSAIMSNLIDDFNRSDSANVGNGWYEGESFGASASITNNSLYLTGNLSNSIGYLASISRYDIPLGTNYSVSMKFTPDDVYNLSIMLGSTVLGIYNSPVNNLIIFDQFYSYTFTAHTNYYLNFSRENDQFTLTITNMVNPADNQAFSIITNGISSTTIFVLSGGGSIDTTNYTVIVDDLEVHIH